MGHITSCPAGGCDTGSMVSTPGPAILVQETITALGDKCSVSAGICSMTPVAATLRGYVKKGHVEVVLSRVC
jgi:hypothetical protein